jgi:TRAP-type C4-dicarboxylate transport system substrate-binding protein
MRACVAAVSAILITLVAGGARAEQPGETTLKLASIIPEGTPWARELRNLARATELLTEGRVHIKWYLGGAAGDEREEIARIRKGQLDGAILGNVCQGIAPTMRIGSLPGVFQNRDEVREVMSRLLPTLVAEAHQSGFALAATAGQGPVVFFTRTPARTLKELQKLKLWVWDMDRIALEAGREMGLQMVPLDLYEAGRAYDDGRVDGFYAIPGAALAWQWFTQARYVIDLRGNHLTGCLVIAEPAYAKIPPQYRTAFQGAAARTAEGIEVAGRKMDDALLGGLFEKQGLKRVPVSDSFRAEYFAAARAARERVAQRLGLGEVVDRALRVLADYRAEKSAAAADKR